MGRLAGSRGLTHMRSMCVGVAETGGIKQCGALLGVAETVTMQLLRINAKGIRERIPFVPLYFLVRLLILANDMIFHRLEGFFAYHMLYFAGVLGRCLTVYTKADKKVCEHGMALIHFFGDLAPDIR